MAEEGDEEERGETEPLNFRAKKELKPQRPQPERKVGLVQAWAPAKEGYLGPSQHREGGGAHTRWEKEQGWGHYKYEFISELEAETREKALEFTPVKVEAEIALYHETAKYAWNVGSWLSGGPPSTASGAVKSADGLAARLGDPTGHGTPLAPGIGSTNVFIGGLPAWRAGADLHSCPMTPTGAPDGAGPVEAGSATVFINSQMACRVGDSVVEALGGENRIAAGCATVLIGGGSPSSGKKNRNDFTVTAAVERDVAMLATELSESAVAEPEKIANEAKAEGIISAAKAALELGVTIPLGGDHALSMTGQAGGGPAAGFEAHSHFGYSEEKGVFYSGGTKAGIGMGGILSFSIGLK